MTKEELQSRVDALKCAALIDVSTKKYQNMFAIVDNKDFEEVSKWKWGLAKNGPCGLIYVRRKQRIAGKQVIIYLHRQILGFPDAIIDHRDGNTLNNTRQNLRVATRSQNLANSNRHRDKKISKYKGVGKNCTGSRWTASIQCENRNYFLGAFDIEEDAARAYDDAALLVFGEFARTNF